MVIGGESDQRATLLQCSDNRVLILRGSDSDRRNSGSRQFITRRTTSGDGNVRLIHQGVHTIHVAVDKDVHTSTTAELGQFFFLCVVRADDNIRDGT